MRLWSIVFASNLVGTALAALFLQNLPRLIRIVIVMHEIAMHAYDDFRKYSKGHSGWNTDCFIVWMMPSVNSGKFIMIFFFIYLIALGDFAHVNGSAEIAYLVFQGEASLY